MGQTAIPAIVVDQNQSQLDAAANVPMVTPPGAVLDPMLATSVHASPDVYVLLLGSGVSTGTSVLTGWQVVSDLVRKVAAAQAPDADFDLAATRHEMPWLAVLEQYVPRLYGRWQHCLTRIQLRKVAR